MSTLLFLTLLFPDGHAPFEAGALPGSVESAPSAIRLFQAQALPRAFGPWVQIAGGNGPTTFDITAKPIGKTAVLGEVSYFSTTGRHVTRKFVDRIIIRTGSGSANVKVRFRGYPLGSTIRGTISP